MNSLLPESDYLLFQKFAIRNRIELKQSSINLISDFIIDNIAAKKKKLKPNVYEMIPSELSLERKIIDRLIIEIPAVKSVDREELSWLVKKLAQRAMLK